MSNCYGRVSGDLSRTEGTRRGYKSVSATVSTWTGSVNVTMDKDNVTRIDVKNVDVILNGTRMYTDRPLVRDLTLSEVMGLMKTTFRKEVKRLRFPDEEFDALKQVIDAKMVMGKLEDKE